MSDSMPSSNLGRVLCRDPLIVIGTTAMEGLPIGPAPLLSPVVADRPAWFLTRLGWHVETAAKLAEFIDAHRRHAADHPRHCVVALANTMREMWRLQQAGVPVMLCNHNAFIDDRTFVIRPEVEKQVDAIYNSRLEAFKRHELAAAIPSLALVYGTPVGVERARHAEIRRLRPPAIFVNHLEAARSTAPLGDGLARMVAARVIADGAATLMPTARVVEWTNRARVGLCLSRTESAMRASIEYLLCGLPVVSTRSLGGREHYFDPAHTRIVDDDPDAIAAAVAALAAARLDPQEIRRTALIRMRHDRTAFVAFVQELIDAAGGRMDFGAHFPPLMPDLFPSSPIAALAAEIAG